jgi:glycosyltransferase involved in cell wall biosynthesis
MEYTKRTLKSLRWWLGEETDYYIIVVDNASTDGTKKYIKGLEERAMIDSYILNDENYYPGKACNMGWEEGLKHYEATHLMRLDNDMEFKKGWFDKVEDYFRAIPELGQLGLDHEAIEAPEADMRKRTINGMTINEWPGCVGGPCVIPRSIWDFGLRWPEMKWDDDRNSPAQEDSAFSRAIMDRGYLVGHAQPEIARTFANKSNWHEQKEYYLKTMSDRGYQEHVDYLKGLK